ncbi:hypothetical protein [Paramicrobacterium chengjingii]|uniref:Small CPxCG-related zinc finger protein n=1 Tax=Paramicrobacterium chengjingii TaxID=2769067 RepID=A0ABX6YLH1_9MICO|nr:hypothetical protein [Microbacterium chengjingii]QPZ39684.1 hypothetical protein HCR76_06465 [Microbacterium chengjingii]
MDDDVDEHGLPPAPECPECGNPMEPESFKGDERLQIAYVCPVHGVGWTFDPFVS